MTVIEYTKTKGELLITDYTEGSKEGLKFKFIGEKNGTLYIGGDTFRVENGIAIMKTSDIKEGVHTPILHTEDGSLICDGINLKAGVVTPKISDLKRTLYLTKRLIMAEEIAKKLENKLSELSNAVYGKSIL